MEVNSAFRKIEVRNASKTIGQSEILSNITMSVGAGECFGILGENGSGKTMLLRIMTGLVTPTSGSISIMGSSPHSDPVSALRKVSALIGIPAFYHHVSGYDNLRLFVDVPDKEEIMTALEEVGLEDEREKKVGFFSRGMLQRLGIALAFVNNKPFTILDEPTQGLDDFWIGRLGELILKKVGGGQSFIITSHDFDFVMGLCGKVMIVDSGKSRYVGPLKEIAEFPYYFQLSCSPYEKVEKIIRGLDYVHKVTGNDSIFELIMLKEMASSLVRELVRAECDVHECSIKYYSIPDLLRQRAGENK